MFAPGRAHRSQPVTVEVHRQRPVIKRSLKLPTFRFDPLHPHYSQMQELVKTAMQQALTGTDPKAALDEAATAFNALVAE